MELIAKQAMNTWVSGLFGSELLEFRSFGLVGLGLRSDGKGRTGGHLILGYQKSVSASPASTVSVGSIGFQSHRAPMIRGVEAWGG